MWALGVMLYAMAYKKVPFDSTLGTMSGRYKCPATPAYSEPFNVRQSAEDVTVSHECERERERKGLGSIVRWRVRAKATVRRYSSHLPPCLSVYVLL